MAAPRKPGKAEALQGTRENATQRREVAPQRDFATYRDTDTVTVSTRLDRRDREAIERHAEAVGLKVGQVVRTWILDAMRREGLR